MAFKKVNEEEIERINRIQADYFSKAKQVFDPPYPDGVPERLDMIVRSADIKKGDVVVDIGTGTGALIPLIRTYRPQTIFANDLSEDMLDSVRQRYPDVNTLLGGVRKIDLADQNVDVFMINACYPNLADKDTTFSNIFRMLKEGGRVVISHPMGRSFTEFLKNEMPFPVDDFPATKEAAESLFRSYGFHASEFRDEEKLYILILKKDQAYESHDRKSH